MKFGQNNHFVIIKTGFKENFQPGPKIPISGPSSYEDSGDRVSSARIICCCCCCCGSHCLTQFHVKLGLGRKGLRLHFMSQAHLPVRTRAKELFPIAPIHIGDRYQTPQEWAAYIACSILRCLVPLQGKAISKRFRNAKPLRQGRGGLINGTWNILGRN